MSEKQEKILLNQARQAQFLEEKKQTAAEKRWENAQIQAATWQSVLAYAVEQFTEHKDELEADIVEKTEALIKERQSEIESFLMAEKDLYLESAGIQAD